MLVARTHDLKMLEDKLKHANSTVERNLIKKKIEQIGREDKDPVIQDLRLQLIHAAKANDNKTGDDVSEQLYLYQLKTGKVQNGTSK